ncbi:MAG: replicative DNA helicase [Litorilinea sp.]
MDLDLSGDRSGDLSGDLSDERSDNNSDNHTDNQARDYADPGYANGVYAEDLNAPHLDDAPDIGRGGDPARNGEITAPARSIPASMEAERAVLGALMIDPDAIIKVANFLRASDFYRERHAWIYDAMSTLNERHEPLDFVTLVEELERRDQLEEIGGPAYISELISGTPTAMYVDYYARIVERTAILRRLIAAAGNIAELAYDESHDVDDVVDRAEQIIFGISESRIHRDLVPIRAIMTDVVDHIDFLTRNKGTLMGVPTGFVMMDKLLGGFQKSDLIILAGRPGMGKTSFELTLAMNAAMRYQSRVAIFSLEMSNEQLVQRLLSMETGIDSHRLRLGDIHDDEWPILMEGANMLSGTPIFIDDTPAASVNDVRTKARRLYAEHGLDLILIDYMQLMSGNSSGRNDNRQQEISYISRSLKSLARELNVPVIAASQLSRAVESRADKRPMLSDLRESGSIEQDADVVLFIYREDYYIEDTDRQNIADIIVAKHRHGSTGTVSLFFRKELTQFRDLEIQRTELDY